MNDQQRKAKLWGLVCSFIYLACFFLSFALFMFVPGLIGNAQTTGTIGLLFVFLSLLTPLSIIASIALMWNRYLKGQYRAVYFASLIPVITFFIVIILFKVIELLLL